MKNKWIILAVLAFALRFAFGVWSYEILPTLATGSEPQKAGYLFFDAYHRDTQAWQLASSTQPLSVAFSDNWSSDQYGGLLWLLAAIYRGFSLPVQQVWMGIAASAFAGSVSAALMYFLGKRFFSEITGLLLAAAMAIYPEAVLLGASQMREPYLIMFMALFLLSLSAISKNKVQAAYAGVVMAVIGVLFISPGVAIPMLLIFAGWVILEKWQTRIDRKSVILLLSGIGAGTLLAVLLLTASWESLVDYKGGGAMGVIGSWARRTALYNAHLLKQSSGIVQVMLAAVPEWLAFPFVAVYGVLQPILPAVLFEPGELFWKLVGGLRSIGWYTLLPLLMAFPVSQPNAPKGTRRAQWFWLFFIVTVWVFVSSLRGGGDQWDNPRYRVILLPAMLLLAAVSIDTLRNGHTVWFQRLFAIEFFNLLLFCHWYSWRYTGFGYDLGIRNTILIGIIGSTAILAIIKARRPSAL